MGIRPRTRLVMLRKRHRCSTCGRHLNRQRKRCHRCHRQQ